MIIKERIQKLFFTRKKIDQIPESTISTMKEKIENIEDENVIKPSDIIKEETIGAVKQINNPDMQKEVLESIGEKMEEMDVSEVAISNAFEKIEQDKQMSNYQVLKLFNGFSDEMKKIIIDKYLEEIQERDNFSLQKEMIKALEDDELKEDALKKLSKEEKLKEEKLEEETIAKLEEIYNNIGNENEHKINDAEIERQVKQAITCKIDTENIVKAKLRIIAKQSANNYFTHGSNFLSHFTSLVPSRNMFKYVNYFTDNIIKEYDKIKETKPNSSLQITTNELRIAIRNDIIRLVRSDEEKQDENNPKKESQELKNNLENFRVELLYRRSPEAIKEISTTIKTLGKFSEKEMIGVCKIIDNLSLLSDQERTKSIAILNQTTEKYIETKNNKEERKEEDGPEI